MAKSPGSLSGLVSEASTGMSYSFMRPSANGHGLVDCVVQWLERWIDQQFRESVSGSCSGGTTRHSTGPNAPQINSAHAEKTQTNKGKRRSQDDPPDDNSEDESRNDPKRPKPEGPSVGGQRRFACPFFKRNPGRYQEVRSCPGPGYKSIHRLKYVARPTFNCAQPMALLTGFKGASLPQTSASKIQMLTVLHVLPERRRTSRPPPL